jgi:DNA polymerase-1
MKQEKYNRVLKKLILIDGNAILHRAYHSIPPFKTSKGEITNAIYGFVRMLIELYKKETPDYLGIAWDRKAKTFRHEQYKDYKATRKAPPDDLYPQLPRLKEIINAFNIPQIEKDGYEADDLLGTISHKTDKKEGLKTIILTGDKDAFQLVTENTNIMSPIKGVSQVKIYTKKEVKEKVGLNPDQIIDYKSLCGDISDNIPGVPGIGDKNAVQLLQKYENLDNIYKHLDELTQNQRKKLTEGKESAYMSKKLATIQIDIPVAFNLENYKTHDINFDAVTKLFEELEFRSLTKKLEELKKQKAEKTTEEIQQSLF